MLVLALKITLLLFWAHYFFQTILARNSFPHWDLTSEFISASNAALPLNEKKKCKSKKRKNLDATAAHSEMTLQGRDLVACQNVSCTAGV